MNFKDELVNAMDLLSAHPKTLFLGQCVKYPGHIMYETLKNVPMSRRTELPVMEDAQLGMSIGLSLMGFIPVSIYPRLDFLILALNQLVNHLDKLTEMSNGEFHPKVIIRSMVGSIKPLYPGPQHCQDHTDAIKSMLTSVRVFKITDASDIVPTYSWALNSSMSSLIIEAPVKREGYE